MGERAITVSRSPYLGALPMWLPAVFAIGMPGIMGITPAGAAVRGVPPSPEARELGGGVRAVQLAGTDSGPIDAARPRAADAAPPGPRLVRPNRPPRGPVVTASPMAFPAAPPAAPAPNKLVKAPNVLLGV